MMFQQKHSTGQMYLPRSPSLALGKLLVNMSLFLKIHVATGDRYYVGFHLGSLALSQVSGYDLRYRQKEFAPAQNLGKANTYPTLSLVEQAFICLWQTHCRPMPLK